MARYGAARSRSLLQPRHSSVNYCPLGVCHLDNGHHLSTCLKQCPSLALSWGGPNADKRRSSGMQSLVNTEIISRPSCVHNSLGLMKSCGCSGASSLPCPCRTPNQAEVRMCQCLDVECGYASCSTAALPNDSGQSNCMVAARATSASFHVAGI
jgi:hypothetical protein